MLKRKFTIVLTAAVAAATIVALPPAAATESNRIDAIVTKAASAYLAAPQTAALSIGVVHRGQLYHLHYGSLAKDAARKPDNATIYPIASITKTFAGSLMAQAAIDGKLKLDDDVRTHLDGTYPNLAFQGQPVRLFHLLNHRSGLPGILPNPPEAAPDFKSPVPYPFRIDRIVDQSTRADFDAGLRGLTLSAVPGTRFQYSNSAAQLAGYVLERANGRSFELLLKEKITAPLGMPDTAITLTAAQKPRLAPGYDETGQQQPVMSDKFQAAGAIKSTLPDMLKYAQWQVEESDAAVKLAHKASYTNDDYAIGLNWQMLTAGQRRVIWQDGAIPGYASFIILQPEAKLALVILSNQLGPDTLGRLSKMANDIMTGIDANSVVKP
jgi:D-alanyl-D-alanine-carboxypeptidase/D-alanyl-D-alanine-endopeptidase